MENNGFRPCLYRACQVQHCLTFELVSKGEQFPGTSTVFASSSSFLEPRLKHVLKSSRSDILLHDVVRETFDKGHFFDSLKENKRMDFDSAYITLAKKFSLILPLSFCPKGNNSPDPLQFPHFLLPSWIRG